MYTTGQQHALAQLGMKEASARLWSSLGGAALGGMIAPPGEGMAGAMLGGMGGYGVGAAASAIGNGISGVGKGVGKGLGGLLAKTPGANRFSKATRAVGRSLRGPLPVGMNPNGTPFAPSNVDVLRMQASMKRNLYTDPKTQAMAQDMIDRHTNGKAFRPRHVKGMQNVMNATIGERKLLREMATNHQLSNRKMDNIYEMRRGLKHDGAIPAQHQARYEKYLRKYSSDKSAEVGFGVGIPNSPFTFGITPKRERMEGMHRWVPRDTIERAYALTDQGFDPESVLELEGERGKYLDPATGASIGALAMHLLAPKSGLLGAGLGGITGGAAGSLYNEMSRPGRERNMQEALIGVLTDKQQSTANAAPPMVLSGASS